MFSINTLVYTANHSYHYLNDLPFLAWLIFFKHNAIIVFFCVNSCFDKIIISICRAIGWTKSVVAASIDVLPFGVSAEMKINSIQKKQILYESSHQDDCLIMASCGRSWFSGHFMQNMQEQVWYCHNLQNLWGSEHKVKYLFTDILSKSKAF